MESHASTTIFQNRNIVVLAQLSAHTDWISCLHLVQYPRLPFCIPFYIYNLLFYGEELHTSWDNSPSQVLMEQVDRRGEISISNNGDLLLSIQQLLLFSIQEQLIISINSCCCSAYKRICCYHKQLLLFSIQEQLLLSINKCCCSAYKSSSC